MAFILQGDTPVPGANAYIDVAFHRSYWADRGVDLSTVADVDLEIDIIKGTQYLDLRFEYVGERVDRDQNTEWPRQFAYNDRGDYVTGLPLAVKQATSEYSYRARSAPLLVDPESDPLGRAIKSKAEAVGPISEKVEYQDRSVYQMPDYPQADRILIARGLVRGGLTSMQTGGLMFGNLGRA